MVGYARVNTLRVVGSEVMIVYDSGKTTLVETLLNNFDCTEHDILAYSCDDRSPSISRTMRGVPYKYS
jgi:hypothetical protein